MWKPIALSIWPTKGEEEEGTKNGGKNRHHHENIRIMSTNYQQQHEVLDKFETRSNKGVMGTLNWHYQIHPFASL
jgi:hypothetical protein